MRCFSSRIVFWMIVDSASENRIIFLLLFPWFISGMVLLFEGVGWVFAGGVVAIFVGVGWVLVVGGEFG